jgi:acyl-CoA synthetase (AMP-forming)/AMP-acid ligase II
VFAKIRKAIGLDRMRVMLTGAYVVGWSWFCPARNTTQYQYQYYRHQSSHITPTHPPTHPSGSAPLAPHVLTFMRLLCACPIHEGYGQTETTAMTSITFPGDWTTGHVGGVAPVCEVRFDSNQSSTCVCGGGGGGDSPCFPLPFFLFLPSTLP